MISESLNNSVSERATEWLNANYTLRKSDTLNKCWLNQWFNMLHWVSDNDTMSK